MTNQKKKIDMFCATSGTLYAPDDAVSQGTLEFVAYHSDARVFANDE